MSEMVERVKQAIHDAADREAGEGEYISYAMAEAAAKAAIAAMREPTEGMLVAMEPWTRVSGHQETVWKVGIDEALK